MFTGQGASIARRRLLRFWSMTLSAVLAITLLQVAPPANAAEPLFVDLVTRADDVVDGQSVLLGETQLLQTSPAVIYRLDIVPECGLLDHIGDIPVDGITDIMGSPISWSAQPENGNFVGTPEKLEQVLDNLRIIRKTGDFGYIDCPTSRVLAYLVEESAWQGNNDPQGTASYEINDSSYPLPTLTTFDSSFNFLKTSRLNTYSNGFEIEWDQFEGSIGYTPAGYSVRYREVFDGQSQRGPWIYQRSDDGRLKSLVVQDPVFQGQAPAFQYEVEVAPTVIDCDSNRLFGKFESVPFVGGFGLSSDPSLLAPNSPQMITGEVVSQCLSACVPTETIAFDGEELATILKFTSTEPCTWTVPSNLTSTTVDAYVVGGGGGGGAAGGGGGGGGGFETSIGLPIAINETWTVRVGTGGVGSDIAAPRGEIGTSSSVTYPGSNGEQTITAPGGGGGGTKDNSGHTSGGDGIYSSVPLSLTFGGGGSGSQGTEGIGGTTVENKYYGAGGNGGNGSTSGTTFIEGVFASGGGGGAVCSSIDALNYPGGTSQNGGSGGYCGGNSQPGSRDGNDATANSGSGGGGGASDADGNDGAGGDGGSGVVYIVHTEAPTARYLPSSCIVDLSGNCASWENTTNLDPNFTATITGAPVVTSTSNPALNGSTLQSSIPVVQGGPGGPGVNFDSITFPSAITPDSGYTLFTVARYNEKDGGQYRRIFDSAATDVDLDGIPTLRNWLSGFWGGKSGIAYHGDSPTSSYEDRNWLTPDETTVHNANWVLSTDQKNLYRSNGTQRSIESYSGGIGPGQLVVNQGSRDERSDFQIADVIAFDYELSESEYQAVEAYLSGEYGICVESCSPPEITTASTLEPGDVGTAYSTTIQVNSASEVSFALSPNSSLPEGLSIDEQTGVISGTPTLDADFTFTIVVTNLSNGQSSSQEFTMTVNAIPPPPSDPPVFSTTSPLQGGVFGTPYSQTITATGPVGHSISYAVVDSLNLPPGLSLDPTSGDISGTPTTAGEYTFTVEATDAVNGENTREDFTITVATLNSHESDVDFGGFEWLRAGTGIGNIVTDVPSEGEPPAILGSGSMRAYWIPNVDADPLTDGIEITCADTSDSSVTTSAGYSTLTCEDMDLASVQPGLTAQLIRNFAASDPWHQISIKLDNDLTESVTGAIAYRIDLASGSNTEIEMTSDGDLILDSADKWFVTTDNSDTNRPASVHYFGTTGGQVYKDGPDSDAGKFWIKKPFTVNSESIQTHRFIDGFTKLGPQETTGEAVIVAMKAADELEHQQWDSSSNILSSDISDVISEDRDLPSLRIQYECRDFGRNLLYPVLVQNDGQPIGCNFSDEINEGLFPSQAQTNKDDDWKRLFKSTFPNATPRLGWACDTCVITSEGPVEPGMPNSPIADGLPLGFLTSIDGDVVDSIRISPKGFVQLHESGDEFATNGHMVAAFANQELNNGMLQGEWSQLPDFDFFYWGRTEYQGRLAFVVTWVMIPTLDDRTLLEDPTTMQLMFVSDRTESTLGGYLENPDDASVSNVDIVWNFHSIQGEGSSGGIVSSQPPLEGESDTVSTYSGIFDSQLSGLTLISDAFMSDNQTGFVGNGSSGSVECDASCVAGNLLTNRLQSPVDGRYVLGYRTYEIVTDEGDGPPFLPVSGLLAPAAPRDVEVVRTVGSSATVSWRAPLPWVLRTLGFDEGTNPIYGFRVEYAVNTRGEESGCDSSGMGPLPQSCATVFPDIESLPLSASDESLIVLGPNDTERISVTIPELDEREQYTFRVFAVYSGLEFPNSDEMPIETMEFYSEVRSAPATANEVYGSDLEIVTAASQPSQAFAAQGLAEMLSGNLEVSNATINGSPYPYGQTEKSVGSFTGGETSIGFDSGIILTPLVDARTFQRGSGITTEDSDSKFPRYFLDPAHRSKYEQIATDFAEFMSQQKSWVPGDDYSGVFDCEEDPDCAFGTTTLQFDIEKPAENDFLKFEYALAGLESTTFSEESDTAEVYDFPDGFGLFVGGIDQASSCALVPQTDDQTDQERFMSMGNALNSRLATEVGFDSDLNSETVTSVMSCVFDVSEIETDSITVTMAIANANDGILSTAVFLKTDSIRFEETSINLEEIPSGQIFQPYVGKQFATTGTTPSSWSATGLPAGMALSTAGNLTGTPQVAGSYSIEITAVGENDQVLATQPFTLQIDDVEQGTNVRNISIDLENRSMSWDHPLGAPTGMLYDVYVRSDSREEYQFATARLCVEPDEIGGCDFYSAIPVQGYSAPEIFLDLRGTYLPNTNYQFKVVARWPDDSTYSETEKTVTSWRDVCSGENSCSYSQSGQITNEVFWEEISYKIDEAQTIQGNGDAFDGALEVYLGASTDDVSDAHRVTCDTSLSDEIRTGDPETGPIVGHEIICSDDVYEDLIITVSRYFFADHQWTRTMVEVENVDQASTFEGNVWLVSNLGSDDDTFYEATSSAAADPKPTGIDSFEDTWAVTSDNGDDGDPVLIHMLGDIKDEDYSSLPCSRYSYDESDTDSTRNSTDCGNVITAHEISVPSGESIKKAWFTGLVGYSDGLLFQNAKNRAIAAATEFEAIETPWTGDMSNFEVPSLFYEIPELTCESVSGGRAPVGESALSVVLLNKQLETPNEESNQTNLSSSTALATQLCNSAQLSTTIFDGREGNVHDGESGTAKAWEFGLAGADVLVLPETDFQLLDSDLLDQGGMNYLKEWVRAGGRIVTVGASNYRTELENIIGIPAGTLQVDEWESGDLVPNSYATDVLGSSLPVANGDLSKNLLKFDESFSDAVNLANANAMSLYGDSTDTSYLSAVTKFEIGRGQASYLSSNFEGEPNVSWNEILLQSVYGTETSTIEITESGKYWNLWRSGVHWTEMNQAASFKLGSIGDSTSLTCMNTPSNPAIRRVYSEGTEIICGKQFVQDGLADAGVSARLTRFVSISGDWMNSNIVITNLDGEDTYENQLWFGGSQNLSSTMKVEATSLSSTGTTNLSSEWNSDVGSSNWIVASEGAGINNVHGDGPSEVVTHVFDPRPNANHGGADRDLGSWPRLEADEIQSDWSINLESDQSITISALTARMSYEPGCDRTAVETSKEFAIALANTGSLAGLPSLRTDCQSYAEIAKSLSAQNSGNSVALSWNSAPTASHYELSYRVGSNGEWTSPTQIVANTDSVMSTTISGLSRSTDYEFKIRAKRLNYGTYGDSALGPWANETVSIRTTALQVPPTTPPTTPPTNEVAQTPAQIVPQMIAQTGPGFPARLKRGKTVKFGMTAPSGLPLQVTSVGQCKTTKITKTVTVKVLVGKKIKKKKVKMQTGWAVKATKKKGLCTVTFSNSGDATRNPLAAAGTITVF